MSGTKVSGGTCLTRSILPWRASSRQAGVGVNACFGRLSRRAYVRALAWAVECPTNSRAHLFSTGSPTIWLNVVACHGVVAGVPIVVGPFSQTRTLRTMNSTTMKAANPSTYPRTFTTQAGQRPCGTACGGAGGCGGSVWKSSLGIVSPRAGVVANFTNSSIGVAAKSANRRKTCSFLAVFHKNN